MLCLLLSSLFAVGLVGRRLREGARGPHGAQSGQIPALVLRIRRCFGRDYLPRTQRRAPPASGYFLQLTNLAIFGGCMRQMLNWNAPDERLKT